jgi:hypothetical protein
VRIYILIVWKDLLLGLRLEGIGFALICLFQQKSNITLNFMERKERLFGVFPQI